MEIDVSPLYLTYYMLDWSKVAQYPSDVNCVTCGKRMLKVERIRDKNKGIEYTGIVCHGCKQVLWLKQD